METGFRGQLSRTPQIDQELDRLFLRVPTYSICTMLYLYLEQHIEIDLIMSGEAARKE